MTAKVLSSQFTFLIDGYQVDICYLYESNWMETYVDGETITCARFNPARLTLSFTNLLHVAVETLKHHHRKIEDNRTHAKNSEISNSTLTPKDHDTTTEAEKLV